MKPFFLPPTAPDPPSAARLYVQALRQLFPQLSLRLNRSLDYQLSIYNDEPNKEKWMRQARMAFEAKIRDAYSLVSTSDWPAWPVVETGQLVLSEDALTSPVDVEDLFSSFAFDERLQDSPLLVDVEDVSDIAELRETEAALDEILGLNDHAETAPNELGIPSTVDVEGIFNIAALDREAESHAPKEVEEDEPEEAAFGAIEDQTRVFHDDAVGDLLARLDDDLFRLREAAHEFAALLHGGFAESSARQCQQKWQECLESLGQVWEELQAQSKDLSEGERLMPERDGALREELERWVALLQEHPGARRLNQTHNLWEMDDLIQRVSDRTDEAIADAPLDEWILAWVENPHDPWDAHGLKEDLAALRQEVEALCGQTLEDELDAIIAAFGPPKRGDVDTSRRDDMIRQRLGWDCEKARTLEFMAAEWKVSRERIRQILKPFLEWLSDQLLFIPVLERALNLVQQHLPASSEDMSHLLQSSGVTKERWSLEALSATARSLKRTPGFILSSCNEESGDLEPITVVWDGQNGEGNKPLPLRIWNAVSTHVWERGIGFVPDLEAEISQDEGLEALPILHLILEARPDVRWLHHEQGWFWLETTRVLRRQENRLLTQITRALSVARRLSIPRLQAALARVHLRAARSGTTWEMPPEEIFTEWCFQQPRFRIEDDEVEMRDTPPWKEVLENTEAIIVGVLLEHGPLLSRWKFRQLCAERGVPKPTFYIYVDGLATVEEVEEGIFAPIGTKVTPEQLEAFGADHANFGKRFFLRYGRLDDGRLWLSYRIGQRTLDNGSLILPLRMRGTLQGHYNLITAQGTPMGKLGFNVNQCWGLRTFFQTHANVGSRVTLLFHEEERLVTVLEGLAHLPTSILSEVEHLDGVQDDDFDEEL